MMMSKRKPREIEATRSCRARAAGDFVASIGGQSFRRFGFVQSAIVSRWSEIVGERYAKVSSPESIRFPSGRKSGGTLGVEEDSAGVWSGAYGGAVETGERVVADAAVWAELWGRLSRETPPAVDFAKTRIAAVFVGPRPTAGYRVRLIGIAVEKERYLVRYYEEGPGVGETFAEGESAPFLLVSVPADERAIRWEKKRRTEGPKRK